MEPKHNSCTSTGFKLCLSLFQLNTNVFINCKIPILKPKSPPNTPIIPLSFPRKTDLLEKQVKILEFLHDWKLYKTKLTDTWFLRGLRVSYQSHYIQLYIYHINYEWWFQYSEMISVMIYHLSISTFIFTSLW